MARTKKIILIAFILIILVGCSIESIKPTKSREPKNPFAKPKYTICINDSCRFEYNDNITTISNECGDITFIYNPNHALRDGKICEEEMC